MKAKKGFTLVEILIVVVILGILAAIVIPQFTSASTEARESALKSNLQAIRSQIELYKIQHLGDALPAEAGTQADFLADMTGCTLKDGTPCNIGDAGALGPYMQKFPDNPFSQRDRNTNLVRVESGLSTAGADTDHWVFNTDSGSFQADDTETDPVTGDAHSTY